MVFKTQFIVYAVVLPPKHRKKTKRKVHIHIGNHNNIINWNGYEKTELAVILFYDFCASSVWNNIGRNTHFVGILLPAHTYIYTIYVYTSVQRNDPQDNTRLHGARLCMAFLHENNNVAVSQLLGAFWTNTLGNLWTNRQCYKSWIRPCKNNNKNILLT